MLVATRYACNKLPVCKAASLYYSSGSSFEPSTLVAPESQTADQTCKKCFLDQVPCPGPQTRSLASVALSDCKINIQVREYRIRHEDKRDDMVIVTSEPLTDVKADWIPVPHNHLLVVTSLRQVLLAPVVIKDDLQAVSSSALPSGPDLAASDLHQVTHGELSQISRLR